VSKEALAWYNCALSGTAFSLCTGRIQVAAMQNGGGYLKLQFRHITLDMHPAHQERTQACKLQFRHIALDITQLTKRGHKHVSYSSDT
jgi:hypothetical protein